MRLKDENRETLIEPEYPVKTSGEMVIESRASHITSRYGDKYEIIIIKRDGFGVDAVVNAIFRMLPVRILRSLMMLLLGALAMPKISRILKNFEIVIINGYFTAVFLLPYLVLSRKKSIYCPHTRVKPSWINASLMDFFDAIVFLSDYNRRELIGLNKRLTTKAHFIYNSIPDIKCKRTRKARKDFVCLFVGRAVDVKRPWLFIGGVVKAWKRNKNIKAIMVVASGPLESRIREMITATEKEFGFSIDLRLNLKKAELEAVYDNASVLVFTSTHQEGLPTVLLEAMQHSLPIVCTEHPKFREFLGDAALFFTDAESLAERILELAKNRNLYEEYRKRSSQRFAIFSPEETSKKWAELFDCLSRA